MDDQVEDFFNGILRDLSVDYSETEELEEYFTSLNPPPDKLVELRATAFRLGCDYLSDDKDQNEALLKTINAIVHSLETSCMVYVTVSVCVGVDPQYFVVFVSQACHCFFCWNMRKTSLTHMSMLLLLCSCCSFIFVFIVQRIWMGIVNLMMTRLKNFIVVFFQICLSINKRMKNYLPFSNGIFHLHHPWLPSVQQPLR